MNCKICNSIKLKKIFETNLNYNRLENLQNVNITCCRNCGFCYNSKITQNDSNKYYETTKNYEHNLYLNHNN